MKTREVLLRLKRRMGKERARYERMYNEFKSSNKLQADRAWYELNVMNLNMGYIDDELRKLIPEDTSGWPQCSECQCLVDPKKGCACSMLA